jgi:hypothetical protein
VLFRRCVVKTWLEEVEIRWAIPAAIENKGYKVHVATAHLLIGIR